MKPVTLYAALDIEECRRRLRAEFPHPRRALNQAVSDPDLRGSLSGHTVVIGLWRAQVAGLFALGSVTLVLPRAFTVHLYAVGNGTRIIGRYSAERGAYIAVVRTLLLCLTAVVGIIILVIGSISLARGGGEGWLILAWGGVLAFGALLLLKPDDRRSRREQERIVRFLERVLEAERVGAADDDRAAAAGGDIGRSARGSSAEVSNEMSLRSMAGRIRHATGKNRWGKQTGAGSSGPGPPSVGQGMVRRSPPGSGCRRCACASC